MRLEQTTSKAQGDKSVLQVLVACGALSSVLKKGVAFGRCAVRPKRPENQAKTIETFYFVNF